jgi:hypothetical protein
LNDYVFQRVRSTPCMIKTFRSGALTSDNQPVVRNNPFRVETTGTMLRSSRTSW